MKEIDLKPSEKAVRLVPLSDLAPPRPVPPFAALRAFDAVGRAGGGVRRAAQLLNLDHAVVSRHIRALEAWVGVPLILRGHGTGGLTSEGATYHAQITAAIGQIADATAALALRGDEHRLVIWSNAGFTAQWLSEQVDAFASLNPDIEIELHPTDVFPDLLHGEADVDVRFYVDGFHRLPSEKVLRHMPLSRPPFLAVASPDVAAAYRDINAADALLNAPLLHEEHDEQWKLWFAAHNVKIPERLPGARLWHAHLALSAAKRGQGLALGNSFLLRDDLKAGRLVEIRLANGDGLGAPVGSYILVAREDRWRSRPLARLRGMLQTAIAANHAVSAAPIKLRSVRG